LFKQQAGRYKELPEQIKSKKALLEELEKKEEEEKQAIQIAEERKKKREEEIAEERARKEKEEAEYWESEEGKARRLPKKAAQIASMEAIERAEKEGGGPKGAESRAKGWA
jgi:hypothetical protein